MKILYSVNLKAVENDNSSLSSYPFIKYSKLDILHGLGSSYITLLFNYWEQKVVVLDGGILAFLFNAKGAINDLKSKKIDIANVFSLEQGYSMQLGLNRNLLTITAFNNEYAIEIQKFEFALNQASMRACKEMEFLYPGINKNMFFEEIKLHLEVE